MRFAPLFGRFCFMFLHLVQELTLNFGDSFNKFCNIFVTILPHLFRFGETSFYGGKKCRFSSFSGRGGELFRRVLALSVIPSGCHLPRSGRQGLFRCVLGSPLGRAVAVRRLRGLIFPPAALPAAVTVFFARLVWMVSSAITLCSFVLAAEAGHAQPSTTLAIYTQAYDKRRKEICNQMSKELYK